MIWQADQDEIQEMAVAMEAMARVTAGFLTLMHNYGASVSDTGVRRHLELFYTYWEAIYGENYMVSSYNTCWEAGRKAIEGDLVR